MINSCVSARLRAEGRLNKTLLIIGFGVACVVSLTTGPLVAAPAKSQGPDVTAERAVVDQYCVGCHNACAKTANLLLDQLDMAHLGDHAEIGEKMIRKLRAGMMPPTGMPQPDAATREALISFLEKELDHSAVTYLPPPGLHRLNRTEYTNAV